jgi:hypothetical protein
MAIGGAGLWAVVGIFFGVWVNPLELPSLPAREAWSLLVIALWNTTLTQYLWIGGLAHAPDITRASYLFFLKPPIAAALAVAILAHCRTVYQRRTAARSSRSAFGLSPLSLAGVEGVAGAAVLPLPNMPLMRTACAHDRALLQHREEVVPGPVDHEAGRERGEQEGEEQRHPVEDHPSASDRAATGSSSSARTSSCP